MVCVSIIPNRSQPDILIPKFPGGHSDHTAKRLAENGQIATQYVDLSGNATSDVHFNPNDSMYAIEGITSPDGRVFGKMGHSERYATDLYKNVSGNYDIKMFTSAVKYFK